jgi:OmpA-OmpF porin, OOP family
MRAIRQMRGREEPKLGTVITQNDFSEPPQGSHRGITMRTIFAKKQLGLAAACALALGVLSGTAAAQVQPDEKALVTDARGMHVTSGSGLCVRNSFGPPPAWTEGCHAAVPVAQYVAPAPAPAPAAAPAVIAAAPLPVYEKVAFDANVLFDSDKSALRPAGRDTLDQFVGKIHGLDSHSMMAVGYADRMGSDASNQALSQQRADAVKTYLVGKGIAAERVQTSAKGEMQPSTSRGECKDANNAKNVACMQPDRHVSVEVSGTRIAKQ